MSRRSDLMATFSAIAKAMDERHDVVLRDQYSNQWRELASEEEAKKASGWLTWKGRR
jgi:hypothetical protein